MCKINDRLTRYRQMKEEFPTETLVQVCVARYEINTIKYALTNDPKYLGILTILGNLLDQFMELEIKRRSALMDTYNN